MFSFQSIRTIVSSESISGMRSFRIPMKSTTHSGMVSSVAVISSF